MLAVFASATLITSLGVAWAAPYPDGGVHIVVGSSPGGTTDAIARLLATALSKKWGQSVIVENRPGASNTIATEYVARSKPDGKTLLMASASHTMSPSQISSVRLT
jgi:tripartite-type tricarboxylate transporter receptor subunit TctC